jgi:RecA-family ATPase
MSLAETVDNRPEINEVTYAKIDAWADLIKQSPLIDRLAMFRAAATDLYARGLQENSTAKFKSIEESIEVIGSDYAELPIETVSAVMLDAVTTARIQGTTPVAIKDAIGEELPPAGPEDYGTTIAVEPEAVAPAVFITPANWPQEAPPPVDWLVTNRIPRGDVTSLHGDGGAGKTDIALQLAANLVREAPDWLAHDITPGPAVFISAEEPEREIRRRIWHHGQKAGYGIEALTDLHLWFPAESGDGIMAVPERNGVMRPTPLFRSIAAAIEVAAPVLVVVDNVAATFAGNQNDRVMVRSFVNLWRAIARGPSRPAVLLLDHPSLSGLTNGTGRGGNMDWRNAVRSALHLRPADDKAEADQGVRIIETTKSNYGPSGPQTGLRLRWNDGGLALESAPSSLHRLAKDQQCDEIFLRLMDERNAQGRPVGDKAGRNYAPAIFADHDSNGGYTRAAFAKAMERLFHAKRVALRTFRVDGHDRQCLDRAGNP